MPMKKNRLLQSPHPTISLTKYGLCMYNYWFLCLELNMHKQSWPKEEILCDKHHWVSKKILLR